jgi:hypothetical protein
MVGRQPLPNLVLKGLPVDRGWRSTNVAGVVIIFRFGWFLVD